MPVLFFIFGLFIFVLLVVVHEYGHFLAAKKGGVEVEEFGVGFPPKAVGKTMGKGIFRSYYTLNWLPLGGFVKLKGENSEDKRPGSFGAASYKRKVLIMTAGVLMNIVAAFILFTVVAAIKIPVAIPGQFTVPSDERTVTERVDVVLVEEGSPAASAGVEFADQIVTYAGQEISTIDDISRVSEEVQGQDVEITIFSPETNETETLSVTPRVNPSEEEGYLGIGLNEYKELRYTWSAPIVGAGLTAQFGWETLSLLGDIVRNLFAGNVETATEGVSGPVGIFYIFSQIDSVTLMLFVGGLISISLAVMNILPIPALDGGRLAVTSIFKFINKPLTEDLENRIHGFGMAFLLILVALITVVDVQRFF